MSLHRVELWVPGGTVRRLTLMFADRHPHAGVPPSYAMYLADVWGYEVELAAGPP